MISPHRFDTRVAGASAARAGRRCAALVCCLAVLVSACSNEAAVRAYFARGDQFFKEGKFGEAIVELRNAVDGDENWGEARYRLAEAYVANGNPEAAYREFIRAADLMPEDARAQLQAANYLLRGGHYEDARTRVERLLAKDPTHVEAHIVLGKTLAGLRDLTGAIRVMNEAILLEPGRSETYTDLAEIEVERGDVEAARAAFEKAVHIDERSVPARLALANFLWSNGDKATAETSLQRALEIDGADVATHRALATLYLASGRPADAERHLKFIADSTRTAASQFALADYYIDVDRPDAARAILEPMTTNTATSAAAETRLAGIVYAAGQGVEAHRMLDRVLARDGTNAPAQVLKARWLLSEGKPEQALARANLAVSADPRMGNAHYVRGMAQAETRRTADAIKSFTEVLRFNPQAVAAQVQLSRLHLTRNSVDSAVLLAEEALRNAPEDKDGRLALIRAWIARDDLTRAQDALAEVRRRTPPDAEVEAIQGSLHMKDGDTAAARAAFERALKIDPGFIEALSGLITLDRARGDVKKARERVEAGLAAGGGENPVLLQLAGSVMVASGDFARAEELLRRSINLDPLNTANFALLTRVYADQKRLDAARAEFDEIARREPRNLAARMMGAVIEHTLGNLEEAKRRYAEILNSQPRAALAANNLAAIYADAGESLDFAQQLAESASEQFPADPEIQDTLGWIYYKRQMHGLAVRNFLQSVAISPENPVYQYHLGLAYLKNGEPERAREAFVKALELNPHYKDAQQALSSLGD